MLHPWAKCCMGAINYALFKPDIYTELFRPCVPKSNILKVRHGRVPYRDSVGNRVLVHLTVLLYRLGVGLTLN